MSQLSIRLLGPPLIERDGKAIEVDTRKAIALIVYLAVTSQVQRRSTLAALLWPDSNQARARTALRRTLTALTRAIGKEWIEADRATIGLVRRPDLWTDVERFQRLLAGCRQQAPERVDCVTCQAPLTEAVALYRGDFLEGFSLHDSPGFDEWQFFQTEGLRRELDQALQRLVHCYRAEAEYERAIEYARRWSALDPLHESAHQQLMLLYAWSGHWAAALRQYQECARILEQELGTAPLKETTELYESIKEMRVLPPPREARPYSAWAAPGRRERQSKREGSGALPTTVAPPLPVSAYLAPHERSHSPLEIPRQLTSFIGREAELAEIDRLLANPECRLLTLIGPGGIGKTRLALQVLDQKRTGYIHGAYFVPLSRVSSADFLVPTIADALKFSFYGREEPMVQMLNYLREKEMLLVMDNFEHLLDAAEWLLGILQNAPNVRILVTSQERLNVQEEWLLEIHGLQYPNGERSKDVENYSAVQLFVQRAQRVHAGFTLTEAEKEAVSRICRLVGGTPLGIELASTWVRMLSCAEIVREIESNLDFLATTLRNVPERHRSLRAVFDYSWQLLTDREREVFRKLSLFRSGFRAAAAEYVAGANLPLLMALADKSFLRRSVSGRYEIPEVLGQYAQSKFEEFLEEKEQAQVRHCRYYAAFLHEREADLKGKRQKEALAEIGEEIDNVRQAWRWALAPGKEVAVAELSQAFESLFIFYEMRSWFREGEAAFARTAARLAAWAAETGKTKPEHKILLGQLLARQGSFCFRLSLNKEAKELLQRSLDLLRDGLDQSAVAFTLAHLGMISETAGEYAYAKQLQEEGLVLYRAVSDPWGIANVLNGLGNTSHGLGEYEAAKQYYRESLALRREIGDQHGIALCLHNLGNLDHILGEYGEARQRFEESVLIKHELDDRRGIAYSLHNLGYMAYLLQDYAEARQHLEESLAIFKEVGDRKAIAYAQTNLGNVAYDMGEYVTAKELYEQSLAIFSEIDDRVGIAFSLDDLGNASLALGNPDKAQYHFYRALETAMAVPAVPVVLDVVVSIARLLIAKGAYERAAVLLAHVLNQPAARKQTRDQAGQLQRQAEGQLAATAAATAREAGRQRKLEEIVSGLLPQAQPSPAG